MDYKDLTALLLKVAGAVLLFWHISWMPSLIPDEAGGSFFWLAFLKAWLPSIGSLLLALVLFLFPATVANKLIQGQSLNSDKSFLISFQILALRLIGVSYAIKSIVELVGHLVRIILTPKIYMEMGQMPPLTAWTPALAGYVVGALIELGLALYLVFGAEGLSNMIQKIRGRS